MSRESNITKYEYASNRKAYRDWEEFDAEDNSSDLAFAKKVLGLIISKELTEKQRDYLMLYYYEKMSQQDIADLRGVEKSTVSRTLTRARNRIDKYLKYSNNTLFQAAANRIIKRKNNKTRHFY